MSSDYTDREGKLLTAYRVDLLIRISRSEAPWTGLSLGTGYRKSRLFCSTLASGSLSEIHKEEVKQDQEQESQANETLKCNECILHWDIVVASAAY